MMVTYATCTVPYTPPNADIDTYAHTLAHTQSTGGKWHWLYGKVLPQSYFAQATVQVDPRGRKADRNARGELEAAANDRRCVDANTTPTTALNSRTFRQGGPRQWCRASLQGGGPLAITTSEDDRCGLGTADNHAWSLFTSVGTNNHKLWRTREDWVTMPRWRQWTVANIEYDISNNVLLTDDGRQRKQQRSTDRNPASA